MIAGNVTEAREWFCGIARPGVDGVFCGAQLIAPDVLLTAAHCMFDDEGNLRDVCQPLIGQ